VKRLTSLALLLASSSLMAAPAPVPKPQRKAEPQPVVVRKVVYVYEVAPVVPRRQFARWVVIVHPAPHTQPPNADPPG
jgi:hypothetical protein